MRELRQIEWIEFTESTNIEAKKRFDKLDNMSILATPFQSDGVGQGDHIWHSDPGKNLLFTLVLKAPGLRLKASSAQALTWFTSLSVLDYLAFHNVQAEIKLPNDIWVDGKKICGILISNIVESGWIVGSIIGVGLNLNETNWPDNLPNPVSLSQCTGKKYELQPELESIFDCFMKKFAFLGSSDGMSVLETEFSGKLIPAISVDLK